jgi:hypothetical protein
MKLLKFPKNFTEIIMEMLNNAETKIEIQNTLSDSFEINKGTKQGTQLVQHFSIYIF